MNNKKAKKEVKYFHQDLGDVLGAFTGYLLEHKKIVSYISIIIGGGFSGLIIGKINISYIPMFLDVNNIVNIIILMLFLIFMLIISLLIICFILDGFLIFIRFTNKITRFIYKIFNKTDKSYIINTEIFFKTIFAIVIIIWGMLSTTMIFEIINNKPIVNIKLTYLEKEINGNIIYNTGNGYILQFNNKIKFIPYTKIDYLEFKEIN